MEKSRLKLGSPWAGASNCVTVESFSAPHWRISRLAVDGSLEIEDWVLAIGDPISQIPDRPVLGVRAGWPASS